MHNQAWKSKSELLLRLASTRCGGCLILRGLDQNN